MCDCFPRVPKVSGAGGTLESEPAGIETILALPKKAETDNLAPFWAGIQDDAGCFRQMNE